MSDNPMRRDARQTRRRRALSPDATCRCGERDSRCLVQGDDGVECYACNAERSGRSKTEQHHIAGRHNLTETVPVPSNEHRILSDLQHDWPVRTLRNPTGSPLRQTAAAIRGFINLLILSLERTVGWIPPFLEALDAWLVEHLGSAWWEDFCAAYPGLVPAPKGNVP